MASGDMSAAQPGQTLLSASSSYSVLEFIGEGVFGKVAKCRKLPSKETVAVKIMKQKTVNFKQEMSMLSAISVLNPDVSNVVKFFESFTHKGLTCVAFEMLEMDLYDLLDDRDWENLSLNEIRPIAKQMLVALDALKGIGILHTDIKPDNIMVVNRQERPLRVKLIDFGAAITTSQVRTGLELQPTGYRAPEISLGLPFTEAIDAWGIGCVLAFLFLAENLFPVHCRYQMMKCMVEVLGQPDDQQLRAGRYIKRFFVKEESTKRPAWRLLTPKEFTAANIWKAQEHDSTIELPSSLDALVNFYPHDKDAELQDRRAFVDLLKGLLHLDGDQRISPRRALQLPFLTMSHLQEHPDSRESLTTSEATMSRKPELPKDKDPDPCSSEEDKPSPLTNEDPDPRASEEDKPSPLYDEDPDPRASEEDKHSPLNDEDPDPRASEEDKHSPLNDEDPDPRASDEDKPSPLHNEDPDPRASDEDKPSPLHNEDPDPRASDEDNHSPLNDEDPDPRASDEDNPSPLNDEDPDPRASDEDNHSPLNDEDPDPRASDEDKPSPLHNGDPDPRASDEDNPSPLNDEDPDPRASDGEIPLQLNDEDPNQDPEVRSDDGHPNDVPLTTDETAWNLAGTLPSFVKMSSGDMSAVQPGQTLLSPLSTYSVLEFIGEGCFGKVAKCRKLPTKETVAIKIIKEKTEDFKREMSMLSIISVFNPDSFNVVKFFERFTHKGFTCLAFEMLEINLYDMLGERDWENLSLNEIRPIAKQMLVALDALKRIGILHTDIKPDNIMVVNRQEQPLRVKLIDFGEAITTSQVRTGLDLQPTGYRAPEISLGLPFTEAIDAWGIGCVLVFLFLVENLFPVHCEYQMMKCMVEVLGQPDDQQLCAGRYTDSFFVKEESTEGPAWRLLTPEEFTAASGLEVQEPDSTIELPSSLDALVNFYPHDKDAELQDRRAFVDLLKGLLHLDGDQRISPRRALQLPFLTMSHLQEHPDSRESLTTSEATMSCKPQLPKDKDPDPCSSEEDKPSPLTNEDPDPRASEEDKPSPLHDEDPDPRASDEDEPSPLLNEDPDPRASDEDEPSPLHNEDPDPQASDEDKPSPLNDEDPDPRASDEDNPNPLNDEDPDPRASDGEIPLQLNDEDPNQDPEVRSDDGHPNDVPLTTDETAWNLAGTLPSFVKMSSGDMSAVQPGQTLLSPSSTYSVLEFIGEGCFGKVAKCRKLPTKETVAVKIIKETTEDFEREMSMLSIISVFNPDSFNVVKFFESFTHKGFTCLAFEMLEINLYNLLGERDWENLSLNEIRPIAKQMLVALDALKGIGILHTDIKPDNIMVVNRQEQPLRVKLIDFGEAITTSQVRTGLDLQPTGYRAPEISLGLPFTEAIDAWGIGCVLVFLFLVENLFPVHCEYQMMKCMVEVLGQPEDQQLCAGRYTDSFFVKEESTEGPAWRLLTPEEFTAASGLEAQEPDSTIELPSSLDALVNFYPHDEDAELQDRRAFVDLLKGLLHLDGDQRISPRQALQLPFLTMSHLQEHPDSRESLTTSEATMSLKPQLPKDKDPDPCSSEEEKPSPLYDEDPDSRASDGEVPPQVNDDPNQDPEVRSDEGDPHDVPRRAPVEAPCPNHGDPAVPSSEEVLNAGPSASSGRPRKRFKGIRRFFRRIKGIFCCGCRAED